jgi:glycosyltransferase involved in cell wall biosynthesis
MNEPILYVTDGFSPFVLGGMQAVARRQIETLVAAGFEVISVSSNRGGSAIEQKLGWRNVSIAWPQRTLLGKFSPYRYVNDLERYSEEVARIIDDVQPVVVYTEGPLLAAYMRRPRMQRVPTIFHPHGLEMFQHKGSLWEDAKSWPLRGITRLHARNADIVVCQSQRGALPRILSVDCGVSADRIFSMPNAVPADQKLAEAPKLRPLGGHFLFVGRDEPRKGLPLLLKAMKGISGATLDIVGACTLPLVATGAIRTHGEVRDRSRVCEFIKEADFVVVPSYAEGMPTVILEAFAQGVPVIATDVGACADAVRTGETGFLVPPADVFALRRAMISAMMIDDKAYGRLSANCLQAATTTYAPETIRDQLIGLVMRLTESRDVRDESND